MTLSIAQVVTKHGSITKMLPQGLLKRAARSRLDGFQQTVLAVSGWRRSLLQGRLPDDQSDWPDSVLGLAVLRGFPKALLRFTKSNPEVTDAVICDLLDILEGVRNQWSTHVADELEKWLEQEKKRLEEARLASQSDQSSKGGGKKPNGQEKREADGGGESQPADSEIMPGEALIEARREQITADSRQLLDGWLAAHIDSRWSERLGAWSKISDVFGELGMHLNSGFDLRGTLFRKTGWAQVEKMHDLLKCLPQLAEIAKALGRAKLAQAAGESETIMESVSRVREELRWVDAPDSRTHTDGIHKSDDIPRMLPMEGSLYTHPIFRKLWKAKFIERSLACYEIKGVQRRSVLVGETVQQERQVNRRLERGPIIVCLDTSGSMQGVPETVSKAITLEAMRLAHAENRQCLLFAFGGRGSVNEHTLELSPAGIEGLCEFLAMSFSGGTDVEGPLLKACERIESDSWSRADVILVSDGQFSVPENAMAVLKEAKEKRALRVHGLLITPHRQDAQEMAKVCDPLHQFSDWMSVRNLA
jgi:uncharacterized protein with von Willebrand factor type A (vWA) domain